MKAYFAHPMRTYNSPLEERIAQKLEKKGWEVVNPKDYGREADKLRGDTYLSWEEAVEKVMKPLFYKLEEYYDL